MMDLLKKEKNTEPNNNQKNSPNSPVQKMDSQKFQQASQANNTAIESDESLDKVDLKKYKDPQGLTIRKMVIGLWFVKHRKHFISFFKIFLAIIGIITWSIFIYTFGSYIIFGLKLEDELLSSILKKTTVGHDYFVSISAQPIVLHPLDIVNVGDGKYDFAFKATNPNARYFARVFFTINAQGEELGPFADFILPGDTKYILSLNNELEQSITSATYNTKIAWRRISKHDIMDWESFRDYHLDFEISDDEFTPAKSTIMTEKTNLNNLEFTVANKTPYNYWEVDFNILLHGRDKIIGLNTYKVDEFMSNEKRTINVTWPGQIGRVDVIQIVPNLNIIENDIYIDFEGDPEKE